VYRLPNLRWLHYKGKTHKKQEQTSGFCEYFQQFQQKSGVLKTVSAHAVSSPMEMFRKNFYKKWKYLLIF